MTDSPREALAELARMLVAHVEWQRDLGVSAFGPSDHALPLPATSASESAPAVNVPTPEPIVAAEPPRSEPTAVATVPPPAATVMPAPAAASPAPVVVRPTVEPVAAVVSAVAAAEPSSARAAFPMPSFDGPAIEGEARITALRVIQESVAGCTACRLAEHRTQTVFARGNPGATVAFVGEGPGRDEDLQGVPFVGAAGQLLDKIIGAMGMAEDDVYICNVVKCRPPSNRVPQPDEMGRCVPYLAAQLALVRPTIIVALGKTAASYLLDTQAPMSRLRGQWHAWNGIPVLPTWHPAYLLRTPEAKRDTWEDMKLVLQKLGRPVPRPNARG